MTSKEGFSVVAPMSVTTPCSTAPSSESCCDFEKRWISSMKRMQRLSDFLALSMTSRMSFTPLLIALRVKNSASMDCAINSARVVLPTPGGPQKIIDWMLPLSMAVRNTAPSPIRCS